MNKLLPDTPVASHVGSRLRATTPTVLGATLIFLISAGRLIPPTVGIGVVILALAAAVALRHTAVVVAGGMIAVALIPVYWGPVIPSTHEGVLPVLGVCLLLLPRAWRDLPNLRLRSVDWMMAAYVALRILGSLVNSSRGAGSALDAVLYAALPYTTFRLLGLDPVLRRAAAVGVVIAGAALSVFTIREYNGTPNPFFKHFPKGWNHSYWVHVDFRFGRPRAEASFGHADALGLFLAFATVLAIALAWHEKNLLRRVALYAAAALCLQGIADTLERGPFVLMLVALPIVLIVEVRRGRSFRVLAAVAAAAAVLALTPVGTAAFHLRDASKTGGRLQASAQDRFDTIRAMGDSRYFSLLGHDQGDSPGLTVQQAIGISTGLGAIENAFMWTYVVYGALAFAAFAMILIPITSAAFNPRLALVDTAWIAIVVACFVIFLSVSFASQFGHFFWIALGLSTAALQHDADADATKPVVGDSEALELSR